MKKRSLILIFLIAFALIFVTACKKDDIGADPTPTTAPTETPADTTEGPTPEPTATKEPGPTLKPIDEEEKGKPHPEAEELMKLDFSEVDEIDDIEWELRSPDYINISDGYMNITEVWSAVSPNYGYGLGSDHNQYEFTTTFKISHLQPDAPQASYFVGARVPQERTADYPGGVYLAFNYTKSVNVYLPGDNFVDNNGEVIKDWNLKYFNMPIPESLDTEHTVTVVDTGDEICYYMNTADDPQYLLARIVLDGSDLIVYNNAGDAVFTGENAVNEEVNFSVFSHRTKSHTKELILKGY